jgi:hypothetical protein
VLLTTLGVGSGGERAAYRKRGPWGGPTSFLRRPSCPLRQRPVGSVIAGSAGLVEPASYPQPVLFPQLEHV